MREPRSLQIFARLCPIGVAYVPVGIAGPLRINGEHARGVFFIPVATTNLHRNREAVPAIRRQRRTSRRPPPIEKGRAGAVLPRSFAWGQSAVKAGTEDDSRLCGDAEGLGNEVRLAYGISLGQPPHSPLPNHDHRFDTLQSSPGTLE